MLQKIFEFDLAKLNWKGWLLFLVTAGLFVGAAFLIAFQAEEGAEAALANRGTKKVVGFVMLGIAAGFFVGVRLLLERLGIAIQKED